MVTAARSGDTGAGLSPEHRKRRPRFPESSLLTRRQVCSGQRVGEDLGTRRASWGVGTEVWGARSFLGCGDRGLGCMELPGAWGQSSGVHGASWGVGTEVWGAGPPPGLQERMQVGIAGRHGGWPDLGGADPTCCPTECGARVTAQWAWVAQSQALLGLAGVAPGAACLCGGRHRLADGGLSLRPGSSKHLSPVLGCGRQHSSHDKDPIR